MQRAVLVLGLLLFGAGLTPSTAAEFGPETEDGWPMNIHGEAMKPPVDPVQYHRDLVAFPGPLNKVGPLTAYPYYPILTAELTRLALDYPHLVRLTSAGKSTAQLDLWMLEIADFENPDMKPLAEREVIYLDGGIHSNEYSGVYFLTEIAQFLIEEYETNETARWIVENRHTWLIPMVNPDGSHVFGRMNANWVNLNRNFPATWGAVDEDILLNNPGPEPASEPETRVILKVLDKLKPDYVNSIHCCGNLWLHPWGASHIPEAADIAMFTRICDEVFAPFDVRDRCGPIWSTIYPASGTTADEGYGRIGASSWTYEMSGRGAIMIWGQPVIIEDVRVQEVESWHGIIHAFLNVERYGAHPIVRAVEGDAERLDVRIENDGYGLLVAGNLTISGTTVALPRIESGDSALVSVPGTYTEGDIVLEFGFTKRILHAPQGAKTVPVALVATDDGFIGILKGHSTEGAQKTAEFEDTPAAVPALLALGVLAIAALVRRTRRA
jgi:hypothetical protein